MTTGLRAARVYQGIAVMDIHHGEQWVWGVDPDTLEMADPCKCVVGQIQGGDSRGSLTAFDLGIDSLGLDEYGVVACGFEVAVIEGVDYSALTRIWSYAIRRLREQRPQEVAA